MEVKIEVTEAERIATLKAIVFLSELRHITKMSHALIAETAILKPTKVRTVLAELITDKLVEQLEISGAAVRDTLKVKRYYYLLTDAGKELLNSAKS